MFTIGPPRNRGDDGPTKTGRFYHTDLRAGHTSGIASRNSQEKDNPRERTRTKSLGLNGPITDAILNVRFNQSIIKLFNNVGLLGPAIRANGEEAFEMVVPIMKVHNFHFSEVAKF